MGGMNSCCIPHRNPNYCRENHTSTPKLKGHKRNLSAAFNIADLANNSPEMAMEQLNINMATEEELMTLPGINRTTAHNIVDYRRQIGGFKKVEDLALVSGVGATKLNQIRVEICVGKKRTSQTSSPDGSKCDLSLQDNRSSSSKTYSVNSLKVNINTANVFQLMKVKGIAQTLAENIVAYRDKRGHFKNLDDLVRVKGVGPKLISAVRPYLVLKDEQPSETASYTHVNGGIPSSSQNGQHSQVARIPSVESAGRPEMTDKKVQAPVLGSVEDLLSTYGPLTKKSTRLKVQAFNFQRDNQSAIRMASWNLQRLTQEKANNPGVKEVVCLTILENGFSLVAVQELADKEALQKICDELNHPTIPSVKKWQGHQGGWSCVTSQMMGRTCQCCSHIGFLFDKSRGIELLSTGVLEGPQINGSTQFPKKPYYGLFKVDKLHFVSVNVQLDHELHTEDLKQEQFGIAEVLQAVETQLPGEKDIMVVGDFGMSPDQQDMQAFQDRQFQNVVSENTYTDISNENPEGTQCSHNIYISSNMLKLTTGHGGVVRQGLRSPWIPDGWVWGGLATGSCPVWAEFFSDKKIDSSSMVSVEARTLAALLGDF